MISRDATPIAHIPPRAPIDLRPTWPVRPVETPTYWELQYEEARREEKAKRDAAMWRAVVDVASSRGGAPQARMPLGSTETGAGALKDDEANPIADESQNQSVNALEDELSVMLKSTNKYFEAVDVDYQWVWKPEFAQHVPDDQLAWVETYFIAVDEILGMPVWKDSPALPKALEKGIVRLISIERAKELNERFLAKGEWAAQFMTEEFGGRWRVIAGQLPATLTTTQAGRSVTHAKDCGYWTDQYPWECDCKQSEGELG